MNKFAVFLCLFMFLMVTSSQTNQGERKVYIVYQGALPPNSDYDTVICRHYSLLHSVLGESYDPSLIVRHYARSINGFAALLTEEESKKLSAMPKVVSVFPNRKLILHKDIDADSVIDLGLKTQQNLAPL
ncbi:PREDICTED: subtilisin-like protease SBT4.4 [Camelina sativa]|uniref:Subtilisin-like protease SBT4.4 n=1 Tax=Camelina sativa TaxID=90675 RepID=A0ABM0XFH9_CAMSA|nr:PREDICTED: subtilisin-like protease SBT4.4 [Camelina sativa]